MRKQMYTKDGRKWSYRQRRYIKPTPYGLYLLVAIIAILIIAGR